MTDESEIDRATINDKIRLTATASASLTATARAGLRSYMSSWLLRSAKRSAAAARRIEDDHRGDWGSPHVEEHRDHVISAVIASATFLEAMINELFTDAVDRHGSSGDGYLAPLDDNVVRLMGGWWAESGEGMDKTLSKYQLMMVFADVEELDRGAEPLQSAALLLRLRNAIIHFKPTTVYDDEPHGLEEATRSMFGRNELMPPGSGRPSPNGVLSAGCAEWACRSAEAFADEVSARVGIQPNYQRLRTSSPRRSAADVIRAMISMFATGDLSEVDETVHTDYVDHQGLGAGPIRGPEGFATVVHAARSGYDVLDVDVEDLIEGQNRVAARLSWRGIRPSCDSHERATIDIVRVESGKAVEHWAAPQPYLMCHEDSSITTTTVIG